MSPRILVLPATFAALALAGPVAAAPPEAPDLAPASDSGSSQTDNLTTDTTPDFAVANPNRVVIRLCAVSSGATGPPASYGTSNADPATFTAGPLAQGAWDVTARTSSSDCSTGEVSTALSITVDTTAPSLVFEPTLVDFVGSNTTFTFTPNPRFDVLAESGTVVTLLEGGSAIGSAVAAAGVARIAVTSPLADGNHTISARATDPAGNTSVNSPSVTITVDATAPPASTPDLLDDDGPSATDNATGNPRPRFTVQSEAGARVALYEDGLALGAATADASGVATVRPRDVLWLDPGPHCVYAVAVDRLGNAGAASGDLCVTITPGVPPFTSNLGVNLTARYLAVTLRPSVKARARVEVVYRGRVVGKTSRALLKGQKARIKIRVPKRARASGRLVVVTKLSSADGRRLVLRRVVRR